MRKFVYKIFTVLLLVLMLSPLAAFNTKGDVAGENGGKLKCETNWQVIPQSGSTGGGNIHWRIEGDAASEFRTALLNSVGNDTFYPHTADGDDTLDKEEIGVYLRSANMLESYVQRGGELESFRDNAVFFGFSPRRDISSESYEYYGVRVTRSSLNTDSVTDDTSGLVGSTADDTSPVHIHFKMSFHTGPGSKDYTLDMADPTIMEAVWKSLMIPVHKNITIDTHNNHKTTYQLDHTDLLSDDNGSHGIVLRNGKPMEEQNYSFDPGSQELNIRDYSTRVGDNITVVYAYTYDWQGNSQLTHWSYVVGTNSYHQPDLGDGTLHLVRTPAGEVLYYDIQTGSGEMSENQIKWEEFKPLENPQVLFVIVMIFAYLAAYFPKKYYKDYLNTYPLKYQGRAEKSKFIHLMCKILILLLFIIYLFPALGPIFFRGIYVIGASVGVTVVMAVLSKASYAAKKNSIPEEILHPPEPSRKKKVKKKKKSKKESKGRKLRCDHCGEVFTVHKDRSLLTIKCPGCGARQRMLKEGYNYLLLDEKALRSFSLFSDFLSENVSGLILTTKLPSKVVEKHGIVNSELKWISDTTSEDHDTVDPKRLDFGLTQAISHFCEETERGVILLDGIEYLVVENSFEEVSKFIKKATDITSMNAITFLVHVNPTSLNESQLSILEKEFDHIEDLTRTEKGNDTVETY